MSAGDPDDPGCVEHVYVLTAVDLRGDGAWTTYACVRCDVTLLVEPGGVHPQTV